MSYLPNLSHCKLITKRSQLGGSSTSIDEKIEKAIKSRSFQVMMRNHEREGVGCEYGGGGRCPPDSSEFLI